MAAQRSLRAALLGGAALLIPLAPAGWAQEAEEIHTLGMITVEGKRGVATDTATPVTPSIRKRWTTGRPARSPSWSIPSPG